MALLTPVTDPGHPLLADFVALNDPARRREVERRGGYFVVEGVVAIERLLGLVSWRVRALVLLPRVAERLAPLLDATDAPVAVTDEGLLRHVVGFDLHRGALASVDRVRVPTADAVVAAAEPGAIFVAAEAVNDHENLGAIYRNAAAFGAAGVLVDPGCADPFYRRSVRVSLGHVLAVPTGRLDPLPGGLAPLHARGITTLALSPRGELDLRDPRLADLVRGTHDRSTGGLAVLVGAEGPGLQGATLAAADHRVSIPMAHGVDSLNVATAVAVALHQLVR